MGEEGGATQAQSAPTVKQSQIQSAAEYSTFPLPTPRLPSALPKPAIPIAPSMTTKDATTTTTWNTNKLGLRISADALAAGCAGVLVAPIITAIDKGIIENASGRRTLGESLKSSAREMFLTPARFFGGRPFGLIFVCLATFSSSSFARKMLG
jgi:hypothetical protein